MRLFVLITGVLLLGCTGVATGEDTAGSTDIFDNPTDSGGGGGGRGGGGGGGDDGASDDDDDGLTKSEEDELGTDPDEADSDGDGTDDGDEVNGNTDPTDEDDFPYQGGWAKGDCRDDIKGEGFAEGDVAENFTMVDQFGQDVSLHDFCDRTVYLVFAAFW